MSPRYWRVSLALSLAAALVMIATAQASSQGGRLTGSWTGSIERIVGGTGQRRHLMIVVDASERGGSWRVDATCRGQLRLKNISNGYHHYIEVRSRGATCRGGGIDCLKRVGAGVYDEFQPQPATSGYFSSATLHRVARS